MKNRTRLYLTLFSLVCLLALDIRAGQAVPLQTGTPITGEIEAITLTTPGNLWSGGTMRLGGQVIILPANLLINLPNDYQPLQQLFSNAPPACLLTGESGLAKIDRCNERATGAQATILANRTDSGNIIAGQVDIFKAVESVQGTISYIDTAGGYFRVNGNLGDATTGTMVRVNDPPVGPAPSAGGRHTVQSGAGCAVGNTLNCSPDTRFRIDPDNYTFCFLTGYPACIPTSGADPNCPQSNRPPITPITTSNPFAPPPVAADSRHFAPLELGDTVKADGFFTTVGGVTFLSAASVRVMVDLTTRTIDPLTAVADTTQPNYLIINESGWDGPAYPAGRVRGRLLTNSTIHDSEIDFYSIHYDPVNNAPHERPLYTTRFNKQFGVVVFNTPTGVSDSQIRYDFMPGAPGTPGAKQGGGNAGAGQEPCASFWGTEPKATGSPATDLTPGNLSSIGVNVPSFCPDATGLGLVDNFNLMVPIFREVMARSTRSETPGAVTDVARDIHGRPSQSGFYKLPTAIAYGAFEDINLGMGQFPFQFSGNPFLLDRRLSPNGCPAGCEGTQQPLTPFPFEGIDPRLVAPTFGFVVGIDTTILPTPNQMFTFMAADGSMTGVLPWNPLTLNPGPFAILPTPALSLFPPMADEDAATTKVGVPVIIPVLANDIAPFGTIDTASVLIPAVPPSILPPSLLATLPSGATVQVNPSGTITYTPAAGFAGPDSFSYTVANNFGSVSLPGTVTVDVQRPPVAVNDVATTPANTNQVIDVVANDVTGTTHINLASVNLVTQPGAGCGSVSNIPVDGLLLYTAPNTVPAGGTCSFSYVVSDSSAPTPLVSNVATVTVTITPSPVPVAVNDTASTTTGTPVVISVLGNDTIAAPGLLNPASIAVTAPTGAIAPNTNSGQAASNPNGTVTYTPPATAGTYSFSYTVQSNSLATSNSATVTVTVNQGHIAPVAVNDTATVSAGSALNINVIGNDTAAAPSLINPASLALTVPSGGTAAANPDGTVTYTAPGTAGTYSFSYTVADNFVTPAISNSATVTVTVTSGTFPTAVNDTASTSLGVAIPISVIANDTTVAPATLNPSTVVITAPTEGSATVSNIGVVTYTPPALTGTYAFTYTVKDNSVPPKTSNVATVTVTVTPAVAASLIVVPNQVSPSPFGTPVTFVASRVGGPVSNEFRFWLNSGAGYVIAQDYSTSNSWTWNPAAIANYDILVDVRTAGSTVLREASATINFYQVRSSAPATGVTLTSNLASPQNTGTPITFTAVGTGAAGPFEYRFWVNSGSGFAIVRDYFSSGTFVWTPNTAGAYDILVEVRTIGNTAPNEASNKIFFYQIQPTPATAVAITSSKASPQLAGTPIVFSAAGSGGTGTYEYRFWLNTGTGYAIVQNYSTLPTWTWIPALAGHYDLLVDVRSLGSTAVRDALNNVFFYQIQ